MAGKLYLQVHVGLYCEEIYFIKTNNRICTCHDEEKDVRIVN